jgi:hypothetical protein
VQRDAARVAIYDPSMAEAFDRFRRAVWPGSGRSEQGTAERQGPRPDAPTFVFVKGDNVVGHVATIPVQLAASGRTVAAHWIVGFMVLPEHRNGLVGPLLIKEVNRTLDCALSLFVEPPVLRILTGLKWAHRGTVPQYLRVLDASGVGRHLRLSALKGLGLRAGRPAGAAPSGFIEPLARRLLGWGLALAQVARLGLTLASRLGAAPMAAREERGFDQSYDQLWQAVGGRSGACLARDCAYLQRRFGDRPDRYRVLACRQDGRLIGYCVVKVKQFTDDPRMGGMKVGTIVDCLFDPDSPAVFHSLVSGALRIFRQDEVHAVLCTASHASVRRLLRANGFFAIPGNLNFAFHNRTNLPLQDTPLESWHLMRGDSDADQNF